VFVFLFDRVLRGEFLGVQVYFKQHKRPAKVVNHFLRNLLEICMKKVKISIYAFLVLCNSKMGEFLKEKKSYL